MRNVARLKMGYYPLPEAEGVKLRSLLSFAGPASVIDPCVGQGAALHLVTSDAPVRRYGVELDAERARIASANGIETIQGNAFDAIARPESFSLLYLNCLLYTSGNQPPERRGVVQYPRPFGAEASHARRR